MNGLNDVTIAEMADMQEDSTPADFFEILERTNRDMRAYVNTLPKVDGSALGLDVRAGHAIYVGDDCLIIMAGNRRALDYYGGFEYVEGEYVNVLGEYVIYHGDCGGCERVNECLDFYEENSNEVKDVDHQLDL